MGARTSYRPGAFSWTDLATSDADGASRFYSGLFGWTFEDRQGEGGTYTMCSLDGEHVAGLFEQSESGRAAGMPPRWNSYVTVDDVELGAARVTELGGEIVMGPFDASDAGRMAIAADPTGAAFAIWEQRNHSGAVSSTSPAP